VVAECGDSEGSDRLGEEAAREDEAREEGQELKRK